MKIKLKASIISELRAIGLRPDMEFNSVCVNKITGAVDFIHYYNGFRQNCVVWPEDYEIIEKDQPSPDTETVSVPEEITLSIAEITTTLDAMYWCFSPYLDNSDLSEFRWIENLIKSYNSIVSILPSPWNLQYEPVDY